MCETLNRPDQMRRTQTKKIVRNEEARQECRFPLVETHKHLTSVAVLTMHVETNLL